MWPKRHIFPNSERINENIVQIEGPSIIIDWSDDCENYYHLLLDTCQKVEILSKYMTRWSDHSLVFIGTESTLVKDVLQLLYPDIFNRIKFLPKGSFKFKKGRYLRANQPSYLDSNWIITLRGRIWMSIRSRVRMKYPDYNDKSGLVYMRRGIGKNGRDLPCEQHLESVLKSRYNARIIHAGGMKVEDQWEAALNADILISPHGASLANILACKPGSTIIELLPKNFHPATFWLISRTLGLNFHRIFYDNDQSPDLICEGIENSLTMLFSSENILI